MPEPTITKRRVTMTNLVAVPASDDSPVGVARHEAVDYVREDFLDAYVADAKLRWQLVEVSDEYDAGPGGYQGETHVPESLVHSLAGQTFAATTPED